MRRDSASRLLANRARIAKNHHGTEDQLPTDRISPAPRLVGLALCSLLLVFHGNGATAQVSDDVVKIGVLNDQSGGYADLGGVGSIEAAKMAVEAFGVRVLSK